MDMEAGGSVVSAMSDIEALSVKGLLQAILVLINQQYHIIIDIGNLFLAIDRFLDMTGIPRRVNLLLPRRYG
jgi:hypothetical protein